MAGLKIRVLGSGTSQGVPVIACDCKVCSSNDNKDKRLRSSILFEKNGETFCIDTGPDFRQQMLREKVKSLRGILYTHEHKDHLAGMDDVRAFNFFEKRPMEIFCSSQVKEALEREFQYVFLGEKHAGIPSIHINLISNTEFYLPGNSKVIPIQLMHYKMPVFGYRIDNFTYITDAKTVEDAEMEKLKGTEILIVNALRIEEHRSHFNLKEALDFIAKVQPQKAYLTHISHLFGTHKEIEKMLPENVGVCYDGMSLEL